jgi:hypothetical protein
MTTHFITAEIDLNSTAVDLREAIEAELETRGEPLRWAITAVNPETNTAVVEAVVTAAETVLAEPA